MNKRFRGVAGICLMAAGLLAMSSCSQNEDFDPVENAVKKGDPTYISLSLCLDGEDEATRSDDQPEVTDPKNHEGEENIDSKGEELKINNVNLYVFSNGILETCAPNVTPKAMTNSSDNTTTVAIETTTGEKVIYVLANKGAVANYINVKVEETTLANFEKAMQSALKNNVAQENAFVMIGKARATLVPLTQAQAEADPVKITVTRAAAKLQLNFGLPITADAQTSAYVAETLNANFGLPAEGATVPEVYFQAAQPSRYFYVNRAENAFSNIIPNTPGATIGATFSDATATGGTYNSVVTLVAERPESSWFRSLQSTDRTPSFNGDYSECDYMGENIQASPVTGNTTFALVRMKVTPKTIYTCTKAQYDEESGKLTAPAALNAASIPADGTFWVLGRRITVNKDGGDFATAYYTFATDKDYKMIYFTDEQNAQNYLDSYPAELEGFAPVKYDKGWSYFRINIWEKAMSRPSTGWDDESLRSKYAVYRNHFYRLTIDKILGLGVPTEPGVVPDDPDTPLEPDTWLSTRLSVSKWLAPAIQHSNLQ